MSDSEDLDDVSEDENLEDLEEETEEMVEEVEEEIEEVEEELEEDEKESDEEELDKPVSEGEVVEVEVEDLGSKGDGIARVDGFVVFVPGGEVDKEYEVEVTSVGRKFAFAEIQEELE
ncbi:MAG: TRAM domain-containing protein [Candidatus Nanohaloarchaea archaeon]